ncbi:hypothetical protein P3342_003457 [Pyrenophora teres f. teres]|nr:hypothetical protein P3342_003457 [Pyrenophora teres f. teres]
MMNFNLIAIKESNSVERLTWVTLLLAKITILFTPVTLLTGYFSIQFKNTEFEMATKLAKSACSLLRNEFSQEGQRCTETLK